MKNIAEYVFKIKLMIIEYAINFFHICCIYTYIEISIIYQCFGHFHSSSMKEVMKDLNCSFTVCI